MQKDSLPTKNTNRLPQTCVNPATERKTPCSRLSRGCLDWGWMTSSKEICSLGKKDLPGSHPSRPCLQFRPSAWRFMHSTSNSRHQSPKPTRKKNANRLRKSWPKHRQSPLSSKISFSPSIRKTPRLWTPSWSRPCWTRVPFGPTNYLQNRKSRRESGFA